MTRPMFTFAVDGDVQMARGLSRFADDVKDLREPFREIVKDFHETERRQFESEGGYGSGGWQPLAPSTLAQKEREGFPSTIMVRTGLLKESLLGDNPWAIESVEPLELQVGTRIPYALPHQKGGGRLPRRPLIDLTEADKMRWMKFFHSYLVKKMKQDFAGLMPTVGAGKAHIGSI